MGTCYHRSGIQSNNGHVDDYLSPALTGGRLSNYKAFKRPYKDEALVRKERLPCGQEARKKTVLDGHAGCRPLCLLYIHTYITRLLQIWSPEQRWWLREFPRSTSSIKAAPQMVKIPSQRIRGGIPCHDHFCQRSQDNTPVSNLEDPMISSQLFP